MAIPEDPHMLVSFINMKLRDGDYENLEDLCGSLDCDPDMIKKKLGEAGYTYTEGGGFRAL